MYPEQEHTLYGKLHKEWIRRDYHYKLKGHMNKILIALDLFT